MSDVDAEASITTSGSSQPTSSWGNCNETACDVCQDPLPSLTPASSGAEEQQQPRHLETPVANQVRLWHDMLCVCCCHPWMADPVN